MMKEILIITSVMLMALAWLLPVHYRPWVTYTGELFAYMALLSLALVFIKQKIQFISITLPILCLAVVPISQYALGQVFFLDKALLCSVFIFSFWLSIQLGYNFSKDQHQQQKTFTLLCGLLVVTGSVTSLMAIAQWLNLESYLYVIAQLAGDRPYGNFAQPNNMATFLFMCVLACAYLYEKRKLKTHLVCLLTFLLIFGIALSQSRTAWVACFCVLLYGAYQNYRGAIRLKWYWAFLWTSVFIGLLVSIPYLSEMISQANSLDITQMRSASKRVSGDMSRIVIWEQMIQAIAHQPWLGYGWHQTSVAYVLITDIFQGPVWIRSSHNMLLDLMVWNGVIIGGAFILYLIYWASRLHLQARSVEAVIGLMMVGVFITHSMFEFPQNYAYFLLPIGFILGIVQADHRDQLKIWQAPKYAIQVFCTLGILFLIMVHRDYQVAVPKLNQAIRYEKQSEMITNTDQIYLLEELDRRIEWIKLDPYQKLSVEQIQSIHEIVLNYPTKYDLLKYAKVLAFNGQETEAKYQLQLLNKLTKLDVSYESIQADIKEQSQ